MAITMARYRWVFLLIAAVSLVVGFYFNVLQLPTRRARTLFWISSLLTVATLAQWGWWTL